MSTFCWGGSPKSRNDAEEEGAGEPGTTHDTT